MKHREGKVMDSVVPAQIMDHGVDIRTDQRPMKAVWRQKEARVPVEEDAFYRASGKKDNVPRGGLADLLEDALKLATEGQGN